MKSALFLIFFMAVACLTLADHDGSHFKEKCKRAKEHCLQKYPGINKDDIKKAMNKEHFKGNREFKGISHMLQCFLACLFMELRYIKDNKINWEKIKKDNAKLWKNQEDIDKANQVADTCSYMVYDQDDVCELAAAKLKCCVEEGKKMHLKKPDMFKDD